MKVDINAKRTFVNIKPPCSNENMKNKLSLFAFIYLGVFFLWSHNLWSQNATSSTAPVVGAIKTSILQGRELLKQTSLIPSLMNNKAMSKNATSSTSAYRQQLTRFLKAQKSFLQEYQKVLHAKSFIRGELTGESGSNENLNVFLSVVQVHILQLRQYELAQQWKSYASLFQDWFQFLAELAYEDSSAITLNSIGVARSLLLDELELLVFHKWLEFDVQQMQAIENFRQEFLLIRSPWPVDRMVLAEGRKFFKPSEQKIVDRLVAELQKNPYRSLEEILTTMGYKKDSPWMQFAGLWKVNNKENMQQEINRIGQLQLFWAFLKLAKSKPTPTGMPSFKDQSSFLSIQKNMNWPQLEAQILNQKLMSRLPINYVTGKPMSLAEVMPIGLSH